MIKYRILKSLVFKVFLTTYGGAGVLRVKISLGETENSAQFRANNKILISCRPKCIQAAHMFAMPRLVPLIRRPSQSAPEEECQVTIEILLFLKRELPFITVNYSVDNYFEIVDETNSNF